MIELDVKVCWGDMTLSERRLAAPRELWIGEDRAEIVVPEELLGARRMQLAGFEADQPWVHDGTRKLELFEGQRVVRELGLLRVEITAEAPVRTRFGRSRDLRIAPFFLAALAIVAGLLVWGACSPAPTEEEMTREQMYLMRQYLSASVEREVEPEVFSTGTRATGEGGFGRNANGGQSHDDPVVARQSTLREAAEYGMVGLSSVVLGPSGADSPETPGHPIDEQDQAGDPLSDALDPQGDEEYADHGINPPVDTAKDPLSTFAVDVDTGSYTISRRKLLAGALPPLASVRAEEFINAFEYAYAGPESEGDDAAFSVHLDAAPSPFDAGHHLLRVAIQGRRFAPENRPPAHLVYLVDTSGSMQSEDKLGLVQKSLRLLTGVLRQGDTVAISTYAGDVREVLPPTGIEHKARVLAAIDALTAGGSTAMASGIELAYALAARTQVRGEISRVIVLSDGDTNVGPIGTEELLALITRYRGRGITLSTVGFGTGNYKDAKMERLANTGDGNYSYIGDERDARRVFVDQAGGLLQVIARDAKIQVELDPSVVRRYRLLGYENRDVADRDFRDDVVDGGEIGSGHSVTAIYDLELWHTQRSPVTVRMRHKPALEGEQATEIAVAMPAEKIRKSFASVDDDFRFAVAVAGFAEVLRGSPYAIDWKLEDVEELAAAAQGDRPERAELTGLVEKALALRRGVALAP